MNIALHNQVRTLANTVNDLLERVAKLEARIAELEKPKERSIFGHTLSLGKKANG
jgi:hypothetical protein